MERRDFYQLSISLLFLVSIFAYSSNGYSQLVGGEAFLQGQYTEVGISVCGSFGTTTVPPAGYHPNAIGGEMGFVADHERDGWATATASPTNYCGDYFLPGTPEEGFGVQIGTVLNGNFNQCSTNQIPGSVTSYNNTGTVVSGTWVGTDRGLQIEATTTFHDTALYHVTQVKVTNTTAATINDIYYMRNVDPDNDQRWPPGNFQTTNDIVANNGPDGLALVTAVGTTHGCFLGLGTLDSRARVSHGSFFVRSATDIWNATGGLTGSGSQVCDCAISISFYLGSLGPGESTCLAFAYILDAGDLTEALNATAAPTLTANATNITDTCCFAACGVNTINFNMDLPATGAISWLWDFGDGSTSGLEDPSHAYAGPGDYDVTLTIDNGIGCTYTYLKTITILPDVTADFSYAGDQCYSKPLTFTDLSIDGDGGVNSWDWDMGGTGGAVLQNPTYIFPTPGTYDVTLIASNDNCADTMTQTIDIYAAPQIDFDYDDVCDEQIASFTNLTNVVGGVVISNEWEFGDGATTTLIDPTHNYPGPGTYDVTLTAESNEGCIDSLTQQIVIHPLPEPDFTADTVCFEDTTTFTNLSSILTGTNDIWYWDFGDGQKSGDSDPTNLYHGGGTYDVTLIVTSDMGCEDEITKQVMVIESPPDPVVTWDTVCDGFAANLVVQPQPGNTIRWYVNDTMPDDASFHVGNSYNTGPIDGRNIFFVQAWDQYGCSSDRVEMIADNYPDTRIFPIFEQVSPVEIPSAIVEFVTDIDNNEVLVWNWDFGDDGTSTLPTPVHQYTEEGIYSITLNTVDEFGCEDEFFWRNSIEVIKNVFVSIPNAFSPNGDGINEEFWIGTRLIRSIEFEVFDRWGRLVYRTTDPNFRWNGDGLKGSPLPEGAYVYKCTSTTIDGNTTTATGSITIIR